jgi:hypothetical protein
MQPQEVSSLLRLAEAGAHPEVLARLFERDLRTIRAVLQQAGVLCRPGTPLPRDWRTGLAPATITAIRAYVAHLRTQEQATWERLKHTAVSCGRPVPPTLMIPS